MEDGELFLDLNQTLKPSKRLGGDLLGERVLRYDGKNPRRRVDTVSTLLLERETVGVTDHFKTRHIRFLLRS